MFDFSAEHAVTPTTTGILASIVKRSPGRVGGGSMCSSPRSSVQTSMKTLSVVPMRRLGDADRDAGPLAVFLASADSDFLTGHTFMLDGGRVMI